MTDFQFDENDINDIVSTINSLFRVNESTGEVMINRNRLSKGTSISWGEGITVRTPNFPSLFLEELKARLNNLSVISDNDDEEFTVLSYNNCEIEMTTSTDFWGEDTFFYFEITAFPNDTPYASDEDEA
jgi:hypothetical protein